MRGKALCFLHIVQHKNGTRSVPGCIPTRSVGNDQWAAGRDWSAGRPAPTVDRVHLKETGRLSGRHRWQASSHRVRCTSARDWSAGRPPSLASQLPQGSVYVSKRLVGCQAAIAGKPAPTGFGVHLQEIGRLADHHRRQASSHNGPVSTARSSPLNRPSGSSPAAFDLDLVFDLPAPSAG
jgi:hypothetical protein